jgi:beta-1,2-mannosyltransferase
LNIELDDVTGCWEDNLNSHLKVSFFKDITPDYSNFVQNHTLSLTHFTVPKELSLKELEKRWTAMAVSSLWMPDIKAYLVVTRMSYTNYQCRGWCLYQRSYLYAELYDSQWRPIVHTYTFKNYGTFPRVLDIAQPNSTQVYQGTEDPRLVRDADGNVLVMFNMDTGTHRKIHVHNINLHTTVPLTPYVSGGKPGVFETPDELPTEKNWSPHIYDNQLHVTYTWRPLQVLRCTELEKGKCDKIQGERKKGENVTPMHGGSQSMPLDPEKYPGLYVSFPRSKTDCACGPVYRPHLALFHQTDHESRLLYVSSPLSFHQTGFTPNLMDEYLTCGNARVLHISSIIRWNLDLGDSECEEEEEDWVEVAVDVQDENNFVFRVEGVGKVIQDVMKEIKSVEEKGNMDRLKSDRIVHCAERLAGMICPE